MLTMMNLCLTSAVMFSLCFNPLLSMIMLIIFSVCMSLNMKFSTISFLPPVMFFMVMVSGLLIIFSYITSLSLNEKLLFKFSPIIIILPLPLFFSSKHMFQMNTNPPQIIFLFSYNTFIIILSIYLLIFLFFSILIVSKNLGALKMN